MAEALVALLLEKLAEMAAQEASALLGADQHLRSLRSEMEWIRCFLRDSDGRGRRNERVKLWVAMVRDASFDAEDALESFLLRSGWEGDQPRRCCFSCSGRLAAAHELAGRIEGINQRLELISSSRMRYGIEDVPRASAGAAADELLRRRRRGAPAAEEADVVGLEDDAKALVGLLVGGEARRAVVSVVGMGGLGKTTLARMVFNNGDVNRAFHRRAWVSVSQEYRTTELLRGILRCVAVPTNEEKDTIEKMGEEELGRTVARRLTFYRYLVVLDDIWSRDAWYSLQPWLPDKNNGSRVLLTTRNKEIALYADPRSSTYQLRFLGEEESLELFCRRAFPSGRPPELEAIGRQIVAKCGGLPLAIVVMGGLLSRREQSLVEWEKVLQAVNWHLREGHDQISGIFALSYDDLPYYLKPCFLYLGGFPEDYEIPRKKLIWLWVAEGFVERRGDEVVLDDTAEDYLEELIHRSMVQVAKRSSNGRVKSCRVHDLLRDLSVSRAGEDRFLDCRQSASGRSGPTLARRLAVHSSVGSCISVSPPTPGLRSLLCFSQDEVLGSDWQKALYRSFRLLRVIDLNGVLISSLPKELGQLVHLRYLGLRETNLSRVPASICSLYNLQTLVLRNTSSIYLADRIWKMPNLRHIYVDWLQVPTGLRLDLLCNLQTLSTAGAGSWIGKCLGKLTNLRKLGIRGDLRPHEKALSESILELRSLRSLWLRADHLLPVLGSLSDHHHLYKMLLKGQMNSLSHASCFPPSITKISLDSSRLHKDPMETLERLQTLRVLRLSWNAYLGRKMTCSSNGFPRLQVLCLEQLHEVEEWQVDEGALSSLKILHIRKCIQLNALPEGLQHMTALRELQLLEMPENFTARLKEKDGEDWYKIQLVPYVTIRQ